MIRLLSAAALGVLIGALLAALVTRAPARDVQATVRLRVYYTDLPQGEQAGAIVYLDAATAAAVDTRNKFSFPIGGTAKRLVPGVRDFWIQPVDRLSRPDGPAFHDRREWPRRSGGIIEFEVRRDYPRPRTP